MLPANPILSSASLPRAFTSTPTITELFERDTIVTVSVVASTAATSSSPPKKATAFPFAVAIPALVGGMALAVGAFLLYWWIGRKKKREKRERWERAQRRQRKQTNAAPRPSLSSRNPSASTSGSKQEMSEKPFIPPVPALPKYAHDPYNKSERGYGYNPASVPSHQQQHQHNAYPAQPYIDPPIQEGQDEPVHRSDPNDSSTPLNQNSDEFISQSSILPSRPRRSVARMAVAESAAANAFADPIHRYQPKKPSPLALKAAEEKKKKAASNEEPLRPIDTNIQEPLVESSDGYLANEEDRTSRQLSGEWGVALGSPTDDGSSQAQQKYGSGAGPAQSRYSDDPYLSVTGWNRVPSGQYSTDPYSMYHDGQQEEVDDYGATKRSV